MKKYKYIGEGAGVPGLPHEITEEQAQARGLSELLRAAIENGSYIEIKPGAQKSAPQVKESSNGQ